MRGGWEVIQSPRNPCNLEGISPCSRGPPQGKVPNLIPIQKYLRAIIDFDHLDSTDVAFDMFWDFMPRLSSPFNEPDEIRLLFAIVKI